MTQALSSLPSEQSSSPSHFQSKGIQRPLLHWNWDSSHFAFAPSVAVRRQPRASSRQSAPQRGSAHRRAPHPPPVAALRSPRCRLDRIAAPRGRREGGRRGGEGGRADAAVREATRRAGSWRHARGGGCPRGALIPAARPPCAAVVTHGASPGPGWLASAARPRFLLRGTCGRLGAPAHRLGSARAEPVLNRTQLCHDSTTARSRHCINDFRVDYLALACNK